MVLSSEVANLKAQNVIVVGGPCANPSAAELMGFPDSCAEGFEAGKGFIRLYDNGGFIALLVAGYGPEDTRRAANVLANYEKHSLKGTDVEVIGTSLLDTSVKKIR